MDDEVIFRVGFGDERDGYVNKPDMPFEVDEFGQPKSKKQKKEEEEEFLKKARNNRLKIPDECIVNELNMTEVIHVRCFKDDMYHLTDEERKEKYKAYDIIKSVGNVKNRYRNAEDWIISCVKVGEAVREIARMYQNCEVLAVSVDEINVNDEDRFVKAFFQDEIFINGLFVPTLTKKGKGNRINIDQKEQKKWIKRYVINQEDVNEVLLKDDLDDSDGSWMDGYTREELINMYFPGETEETLYVPFSDEVEDFYAMEFDEEEHELNAKYLKINENPDKKFMKEVFKAVPHLKTLLEERSKLQIKLDKINSFNRYDDMFESKVDDMADIGERDRKLGYKDKNGRPELDCSIRDFKKFKDWCKEVDLWDYENALTHRDSRGNCITQQEYDNIKAMELFERNGINTKMFKAGNIKKEKAKKSKKVSKVDQSYVDQCKINLANAKEIQKRHANGDYSDLEAEKKKKGKGKDSASSNGKNKKGEKKKGKHSVVKKNKKTGKYSGPDADGWENNPWVTKKYKEEIIRRAISIDEEESFDWEWNFDNADL